MKSSLFLFIIIFALGCDLPLPEAEISISKNSDLGSSAPTISVSTISGLSISQNDLDATAGDVRFGDSSGDIVMDSNGNLFFTVPGRSIIRKMTPSGFITTFAGKIDVVGDLDGQGTSAEFNGPLGIAIDSLDNLYVADEYNDKIRKITPSGYVSSLDSTALTYPKDIVVTSTGRIFVSQPHCIKEYTPGTIPQPLGPTPLVGVCNTTGDSNGTGSNALFSSPNGLAVDSLDNLYVCDHINEKIKKITLGGIVTTFASGTSGCGYLTIKNAPFTIYVNGQATITEINSSGNKLVLAGSGQEATTDGVGLNADITGPHGVTLDSNGQLYFIQGYGIRKIDTNTGPDYGKVTSVAGRIGSLSTVNGQGSSVRFNQPGQVAKDSSGNLFVTEYGAHVIRKISPTGIVTTYAGAVGSPGTSNGSLTSARFNSPMGIVIDSNDNLYVTEYYNHSVRKITPGGVVSTLAGLPGTSGDQDGSGTFARFSFPTGIAIDGNGDLYLTDMGNHLIKKITPSGDVTKIAGISGSAGKDDGAALGAATFNQPAGITVDATGNIFVSDTANCLLRKITSGIVTTIAGNWLCDNIDGNGTNAYLGMIYGIVSDSEGNLFVSDMMFHTIRKITPNGDVTTLLGSPSINSSIDGNSSTARLSQNVYLTLIGNEIYFAEVSGAIRKFNYK